jgi:hypothetical protein
MNLTDRDYINGKPFVFVNDPENTLDLDYNSLINQTEQRSGLIFRKNEIWFCDMKSGTVKKVEFDEENFKKINLIVNSLNLKSQDNINKPINIKPADHVVVASCLGLDKVALSVSQAQSTDSRITKNSLCFTLGISHCSVLLIVNIKNKDYFFAHVGPTSSLGGFPTKLLNEALILRTNTCLVAKIH